MPRWLRVGRKALRKYWQLAGLMGAVLLTGCDPKLEEVDASVVGLTIQIATNLVIIQAGTNASAYLSEANFPVVTATHNLPTNGYSFTSLSAPRYYYPGTGTGYDFPLGRTQVKVGVRLIATAHNNGINNGIDYDSGVSTSFTVQVIGIPQTPPPASPLPPVGFTNLASFGINTTNAFANGVLGECRQGKKQGQEQNRVFQHDGICIA